MQYLKCDFMNVKKVQKGFLNPEDGEVFFDNKKLHEITARDICSNKGYKWDPTKYPSAAEYLIEEKSWIKISNYGPQENRYIEVSKKTFKRKLIRETAELLSDILRVRIDTY